MIETGNRGTAADATPRLAPAAPSSYEMSYQLQIVYEPSGYWSLHGLPGNPMVRLGGLAAAIDFARRECDAEPATIELMIDGFYAVIHQESGWPRRLIGPEHHETLVGPAERAVSPPASGLRGWVRRWGKGP